MTRTQQLALLKRGLYTQRAALLGIAAHAPEAEMEAGALVGHCDDMIVLVNQMIEADARETAIRSHGMAGVFGLLAGPGPGDEVH